MPNIDQAADLADNLARLLDQIKTSGSSSAAAAAPVAVVAAAPNVPSIAQPAFKTNADIKFNSSNPGLNRVTLSYPRMMMLLNKLKITNPTKADSALSELTAATTAADVQSIINKNQLNFYGNSVSGGTKKRRMNKNKRTNRKKARHSRR